MASLPPQPAPDLPPGCSFSPGDDELLSLYLRRRIARMPLPAATAHFFHDADVYAADPATLVAGFLHAPAPRIGESKNWFFFSSVRPKSSRGSRKSRTVGDGKGTWKAERAKDVVDREGRVVGHRHSFTYRTKSGGKPEWLMMEFGVDQEDGEGRRVEPVPVLCKIYQSPRFLQSASKSSAAASSRKRKVTDERLDLASSSRVRRQLFPSPPAPTPPDEEPTFDLDDFLMPVEPQPQPQPQPQPAESQGETSLLNSSFSMANHAHSELSCYDTTLLGDGGDWGIPPCASDAENSGSWTGDHTTASCTSGMEFLAGLPTGEEEFWTVARFGQDASYWCSEPSAPGSSAASTLFCGGVNSCNAIAAP